MKNLNYHCNVTASAEPGGNIALKSEDVPLLVSAASEEYDGPGDQWSPELLLVASVLDGFILSFRAIAKLSDLEWNKVTCQAVGTVERVKKVTQFTAFEIAVTLTIPEEADKDRALRLLEKSQATCIVANSLTAEISLKKEVVVES